MADNDSTRFEGCLFCAMASGEVRSHIVFEDRNVVAFLDNGPIREGHVQIIPRTHFPFFEDLPPNLANRILAVGQRIAKVQKRLYGVEQVAFLFSGGDIAHAHAHLVPMIENTDITSRRYIKEDTVTFQMVPGADEHELERVASKLRSELGILSP